jgi:alpha-D-ribose 1-methylphosphonate 5-triphosphate synthase subunit PhnL
MIRPALSSGKRVLNSLRKSAERANRVSSVRVFAEPVVKVRVTINAATTRLIDLVNDVSLPERLLTRAESNYHLILTD